MNSTVAGRDMGHPAPGVRVTQLIDHLVDRADMRRITGLRLSEAEGLVRHTPRQDRTSCNRSLGL
jgi:hypothetical protein